MRNDNSNTSSLIILKEQGFKKEIMKEQMFTRIVANIKKGYFQVIEYKSKGF